MTNCTREKLSRPAPARELYRGSSVRNIVKAVDEARAGGVDVKLYIMPAVCERRDVYVLSPYRPHCGVWIKTGNFDKHLVVKRLLLNT
ncbi:MAG: hypothetical protein ACK4SY_08730 [Pyrobaculum sp.]